MTSKEPDTSAPATKEDGALPPVTPVERFDPPKGDKERRIFQNGDTDRNDSSGESDGQ